MARFRFGMQGILDIKEKLETQSKQAFASAQATLTTEEEKLQAITARRAEYFEKGRSLRSGSLSVLELEENQNALKVLDDYVSEQSRRVDLARRRVERAREDMAEAMRERKTYETLREKAFAEFLLEEGKAEGKTVDELVSYTYGQRQQAADTESKEG